MNFDELYHSFSDMVYQLCLNYFRNKADAEDCAQDVFVKVYNKRASFKGEAELKTWIYRITVNTCMDKVRSQQRKQRLMKLLPFYTPRMDVEFDHPGVLLEQKEAVDKIMKAIDKLPEKQRHAIILKRIEKLSQKEVAAILECSEKAVESLLSRATKQVKILLNEGNAN